MINSKIEEAINKQINAEIFSAYLYMSMSACFQSINLAGFAHWMELQSAEEYTHAKKFYNYVLERGGKVKLTAIEAPQTEWKSAEDVFEETLKHEQHVTSLINNLVDLAIQEKDHATNNMLQWFVAEQVEEESTADDILQQIKLVGTDGSGLYLIDKELAQRAFNFTALAGEGTE